MNLKLLFLITFGIFILCMIWPVDFLKFLLGISSFTLILYLIFLGEKRLEAKPEEQKSVDPRLETNYWDYYSTCREAGIEPISEKAFNKIHHIPDVAVYIPTELDHILGNQNILEQEESS